MVVVLSLVFVLLGQWQLRRLDDRRFENEAIAESLTIPPVEWPSDSVGIPTEYSRVELFGSFEPAEEVLLRSQTHLGQPGFDVFSPFYVNGATVVVVNRGWVPLHLDSPPVLAAAPPEGAVTISGVVRYPLAGATAVEANSPVEPVSIIAKVDLDLLNLQIAGAVEPFYLELTTSSQVVQDLPVLPADPEITEGPHFSYAMQWFAFAAVSVGGYVMLIRSTARRNRNLMSRATPPPLDSL